MISPFRVPKSFQFFEIDKDKNKEIEKYISQYSEVNDLHKGVSLYNTQRTSYLFDSTQRSLQIQDKSLEKNYNIVQDNKILCVSKDSSGNKNQNQLTKKLNPTSNTEYCSNKYYTRPVSPNYNNLFTKSPTVQEKSSQNIENQSQSINKSQTYDQQSQQQQVVKLEYQMENQNQRAQNQNSQKKQVKQNNLFNSNSIIKDNENKKVSTRVLQKTGNLDSSNLDKNNKKMNNCQSSTASSSQNNNRNLLNNQQKSNIQKQSSNKIDDLIQLLDDDSILNISQSNNQNQKNSFIQESGYLNNNPTGNDNGEVKICRVFDSDLKSFFNRSLSKKKNNITNKNLVINTHPQNNISYHQQNQFIQKQAKQQIINNSSKVLNNIQNNSNFSNEMNNNISGVGMVQSQSNATMKKASNLVDNLYVSQQQQQQYKSTINMQPYQILNSGTSFYSKNTNPLGFLTTSHSQQMSNQQQQQQQKQNYLNFNKNNNSNNKFLNGSQTAKNSISNIQNHINQNSNNDNLSFSKTIINQDLSNYSINSQKQNQKQQNNQQNQNNKQNIIKKSSSDNQNQQFFISTNQKPSNLQNKDKQIYCKLRQKKSSGSAGAFKQYNFNESNIKEQSKINFSFSKIIQDEKSFSKNQNNNISSKNIISNDNSFLAQITPRQQGFGSNKDVELQQQSSMQYQFSCNSLRYQNKNKNQGKKGRVLINKSMNQPGSNDQNSNDITQNSSQVVFKYQKRKSIDGSVKINFQKRGSIQKYISLNGLQDNKDKKQQEIEIQQQKTQNTSIDKQTNEISNLLKIQVPKQKDFNFDRSKSTSPLTQRKFINANSHNYNHNHNKNGQNYNNKNYENKNNQNIEEYSDDNNN